MPRHIRAGFRASGRSALDVAELLRPTHGLQRDQAQGEIADGGVHVGREQRLLHLDVVGPHEEESEEHEDAGEDHHAVVQGARFSAFAPLHNGAKRVEQEVIAIGG